MRRMHAMDDTPPRRRAIRSLALRWAGLLLVLLFIGCGYRQDVPVLPAGARTIAIGAINNLTAMGELDVRLRALLQRDLLRRRHVAILAVERSDLVISVDLTALTITRVLDPAITTDRSFAYALSGRVTLTDQRTGQQLVSGRGVTASVTRLYAPEVRETPAIRDEGLNDVLAAFAEQVQREVFLVF